MDFTAKEIIVWLIVGGLAGSLVGMIVKRKKEGFGSFVNLGIGLVGAFIGAMAMKAFPDIESGLENYSISLDQLVAALLGSIVFLILVWLVKKLMKSKSKSKA